MKNKREIRWINLNLERGNVSIRPLSKAFQQTAEENILKRRWPPQRHLGNNIIDRSSSSNNNAKNGRKGRRDKNRERERGLEGLDYDYLAGSNSCRSSQISALAHRGSSRWLLLPTARRTPERVQSTLFHFKRGKFKFIQISSVKTFRLAG